MFLRLKTLGLWATSAASLDAAGVVRFNQESQNRKGLRCFRGSRMYKMESGTDGLRGNTGSDW